MAPISDERELYAAVLADPNDDDRRRALAAWYRERGDPRAEFIRIQLANAATEAVGVFDGRLIMRERELLVAHGTAWRARLTNLVTECIFHRGLIGEVTLPADRFLEVAPALFAAAPIQHLNLTAPTTQLTRLLSAPYLDRLVSLGLDGWGLDDDDARALADAAGLRHLSWLGLGRNGIGQAGVDALAASPWLADLDVLDLSLNPCDPTPKPGGYDLDGRAVAIDRPTLADELVARHGPRPWLANPENPDAWPLPRDSYRPGRARLRGS
ncbi:MAG TPA: TIGR02996 domain-containing protein, partial [Kineosporiaceae bacterium]|nr:TIGR02996 domain-containing protein [Kineosporiaceae bacterium]